MTLLAAALTAGAAAQASTDLDARTLGYLDAALSFCVEADADRAPAYRERIDIMAAEADIATLRKTADYQQAREAMDEQLTEEGRDRPEELCRAALE